MLYLIIYYLTYDYQACVFFIWLYMTQYKKLNETYLQEHTEKKIWSI